SSDGARGTPSDSLQRAAELAEHLGDPELLARAALGCAGHGVGLIVATGNERAILILRKALAALGGGGSALRGRGMSDLVRLQLFAGDPREGRSLAHRAIEMAQRVGDTVALAYVLSATMYETHGPDDVPARHAQVEQLIRLAEEAGDARLATEGHQWK